MASPKAQFPSYLNFVIIVLMAVVVTFRSSVCLPADKQDQVLAAGSSLGIWGYNKEGQSKASNFTIQKRCLSTNPCVPGQDCGGPDCECKGSIGFIGIAFICGEATACVPGAVCSPAVVNGCGAPCTCELGETGYACKSAV